MHAVLIPAWRLLIFLGLFPAVIRGRQLSEGGSYPRAAVIRGRQLSEGGSYPRAAVIRANTVHG